MAPLQALGALWTKTTTAGAGLQRQIEPQGRRGTATDIRWRGLQCKMLQDAEDSAHLPTIVNNHFDSITRLNTRSNEIGADRASAGTAALEARLVTLAEEAALTDKSAIIRWSDDRAEYVVDPRVEGRIITVGTSATDAWALE